jgi:hypothetical protein
MSEHDQLPAQGGAQALQTALRGMWDHAQRAAALITALREENTALRADKTALEHEAEALRLDLAERDRLIDDLKHKVAGSGGVDPTERLLYLSADEREALERQIDDLLVRINAHLGAVPR